MSSDPQAHQMATQLSDGEHARIAALREHGDVQVSWKGALCQRQVLHARSRLCVALLQTSYDAFRTAKNS